jgi:hypothetical protein
VDAFLTSDGLLALVTLTFLEIILGVDNVIFISILSGKLPAADQLKARRTRRRDADADRAADVDRVDRAAHRAAVHGPRP